MAIDRKTLIADTAIQILSSTGSRGLTHRAVDAAAGLPAGSTSFYCRTRFDLIAAAMARHAELDLADLADDAKHWAKGSPSVDRFIESLSRRMSDWLSPGNRDRLLARFELLLIASREPQLQQIVKGQRQQFFRATVQALKYIGVPHPDDVAPQLMMAVDGMLLNQINQAGRPMTDARRKLFFKQILATQERSRASSELGASC